MLSLSIVSNIKNTNRSALSAFKTRGAVGSIDADKTRSASILYALKNDASYELNGEKSLEIDEVYAEKIKIKIFVNQQNSVL